MEHETSSRRAQKLNELLKEVIGELLFRNIDIPRDMLITISRADTSSDLKNSTIYITVFPESKEKEVLTSIQKQIYLIQKTLNRTLRTKPVPKLRFEVDVLAKS